MFNTLNNQGNANQNNSDGNLTPVRMAKIKNTDDIFFWRGYVIRGTLIQFCWEWKLVQPLWKSIWRLLRVLGINLPLDPAIIVLDIYPKDAQSYYKDISSTMFIGTLFVITRTWEESRCPWIKECVRKCGTFTH